jgi:hypothetical protein
MVPTIHLYFRHIWRSDAGSDWLGGTFTAVAGLDVDVGVAEPTPTLHFRAVLRRFQPTTTTEYSYRPGNRGVIFGYVAVVQQMPFAMPLRSTNAF